MSQVVIDTDVLILHLRGNKQIKEVLKEVAQSSLLCCSAITIGEIYAGMKDEEREKTERLLDGLLVFDVDRKIAELAGFYRRSIKSHHLELDDCLIAATCVQKKSCSDYRQYQTLPHAKPGKKRNQNNSMIYSNLVAAV